MTTTRTLRIGDYIQISNNVRLYIDDIELRFEQNELTVFFMCYESHESGVALHIRPYQQSEIEQYMKAVKSDKNVLEINDDVVLYNGTRGKVDSMTTHNHEIKLVHGNSNPTICHKLNIKEINGVGVEDMSEIILNVSDTHRTKNSRTLYVKETSKKRDN